MWERRSDWLLLWKHNDFLKNNCCGYKIFHRETEQKRCRVLVSADGQPDAAESFCVSDLGASSVFSGSPGVFLLSDKTNLIHPSGELKTKCKLSLITYKWKFNPLALMQNQLNCSLLTVWSFTICGSDETLLSWCKVKAQSSRNAADLQFSLGFLWRVIEFPCFGELVF